MLSAGAALMSLLLILVLVRGIRRHPVWINFALTWIIFGISYILLYICGQAHGPEPSLSLCLSQAALVYAAPVL
jgi:dipeptide/tripeptide permease